MSDIIERLRAVAKGAIELEAFGTAAICIEAADEIERLTALLKAASYHVESEGDVSLLTEIRRALEQK